MSTPFMIGSVSPIDICSWTNRGEAEAAEEAPAGGELLTDRPAA